MTWMTLGFRMPNFGEAVRDDEFGGNEFFPWDILVTTSVGSQPYGSRAQGKILDGNLV